MALNLYEGIASSSQHLAATASGSGDKFIDILGGMLGNANAWMPTDPQTVIISVLLAALVSAGLALGGYALLRRG